MEGGMSLKEKALLGGAAMFMLYAMTAVLWFTVFKKSAKGDLKAYAKACENRDADARLIGEKDAWEEKYRTAQDVVMSVRPEELLLSRDADAPGIGATVDDCVFLGLMTHYFVHLESGEEAEIIQESSIDSIIEPGTRIRLTINTDKVNLFTADGSANILTGVQNDCAGA